MVRDMVYRYFKYRLWTNSNQERELDAMLETHRRLYNECLANRISAYISRGETVTRFDQTKWFTSARRSNRFYGRLSVSSARGTIRTLDMAYSAFFSRVAKGTANLGFPRFKPKGRFSSFDFLSHGDGVRLSGSVLYVKYIGSVRVRMHRPCDGEIRTVRIKKECGKWYACFVCLVQPQVATTGVKDSVGIDVGVDNFLVTSRGNAISNPRFLENELPKLRRLQRAHSRKKKGGSNRQKSRRKIAKLHARIANQRRDFHHKVALKLVRRYGWIATESLNIRGMLRNGRLAKAIADAGWYSFQQILCNKAESAGCKVVKVDPRGTSQTCPCGESVPKKLSDRWHECPACGFSANRDHASALVILQRSLEDAQARAEPAGVNVNHLVKRPQRSRQRKLVK